MVNLKLLIFLIGTIIGLIVFITVNAVKHKKKCEKKESGCNTSYIDEEIRSLKDSNSTLVQQNGQLQAQNSSLKRENSEQKEAIVNLTTALSTKEGENENLLAKLNACSTPVPPVPPVVPHTTPFPPATNKANVWKSGIAMKTAIPISIACIIGVVVLLVRRWRGTFGARSSESDGDDDLPRLKSGRVRSSSARPSQSRGFRTVGEQLRYSSSRGEDMGGWLDEAAKKVGILQGYSARSSPHSSTSRLARSSSSQRPSVSPRRQKDREHAAKVRKKAGFG